MKIIQYLLVALFLMAMMMGATAKNCKCDKKLQKECGSDGVTYANPCLRKCAGMSQKTFMSCMPLYNKM